MARVITMRPAPARRILILNPFGNPGLTATVQSIAERQINPGTRVRSANPDMSPFSPDTPGYRHAAEAHVGELVRALPGQDAYVLAAFEDIGLFEMRTITGRPVVGSCEAGIAAIRTIASRFAVVTLETPAVPAIGTQLARYGAADIATVRTVPPSGEPSQTAVLKAAREAIDRDGARAILLGSVRLSEHAAEFSRRLGVPVIDGLAAAVKLAEAMAIFNASAGMPRSADEPRDVLMRKPRSS